VHGVFRADLAVVAAVLLDLLELARGIAVIDSRNFLLTLRG
jgi:hypothetical protein